MCSETIQFDLESGWCCLDHNIGILMHDEDDFAMVGMEEGSTGNNVQSRLFMVVNASDRDSSTSPF